MDSTYKNAPLMLNLEHNPAAGGSWHLASTWCNLGLWPTDREPCSFQCACKELAVTLGEAAGLSPGNAVLDVGVGYGDQTALWATRFGVRRVVAVEVSAAHVVAASEAQQTGRLAGGGVVEFRVGSAGDIDDILRTDEMDGAGGFDCVLCLDCAYHFRTRASFLHAASRALRLGGRFAAVDLIAVECDDAAHAALPWWRVTWRSVARRAIGVLCDIPAANLHGLSAYKENLSAAGLQCNSTQLLTERVFAPFAAHAVAQRRALASELSIGQAVFLRIIAALFSFVAWSQLFDVVLVRAEKRT